MEKCPESIEELDALEKFLPLCRQELLKQVGSRLDAGSATSERDATRQLAEETGRNEEGIRSSLKRAKKEVGSVNPEGVEWSRGRAGVWQKQMALAEKCKHENLVQEYKEVCEMLGLEVPDEADERIKTNTTAFTHYVTKLMREINRRGTSKRRVPVDSFFRRHREIRGNYDLCWRCLQRKPATVKHGLCGGCAKMEAEDKKQEAYKAKLEKRGVDDKSTEAWQGVFDEIEVLVNRVAVLLEQESPPKISQEQAELVIQVGRHLQDQLWGSDLLKIVNADCFT